MKNLLKNKKGFTLAEILLVIAIIVILSGATVIGVASWLNSSKATAEKIAHDAADFEPAANESVKKKKGTLGSLPQETETLNTGTQQQDPDPNQDPDPKDDPKEDPKEDPKDGPKDDPKDGPKDGPKDDPKDPPKLDPKEDPKDDPKDGPKDDPKDDQQGQNGNYAITGNQVKPTYDWWTDHGRARFNYSNLYTDQKSLTTAVVKAPPGTQFDTTKFNVTNNGDGTYTLKLKTGYFNPWDTNLDYRGTQLNDSNFALIGLS